MNENVLKYNGYSAAVEYSAEDQVLYGKIDGINDLVTFSSESAAEIEKEFHEAVDGYLALCAEIGKEPNKEYSGTFNVRIKPENHRQMAIRAAHNGGSLNAEVEKAIEYYLTQFSEDRLQKIQINVSNQVSLPNHMAMELDDTAWEGGFVNGYSVQKSSPVLTKLS